VGASEGASLGFLLGLLVLLKGMLDGNAVSRGALEALTVGCQLGPSEDCMEGSSEGLLETR